MRTIMKEVYSIKELSGEAQERAFDWLREVATYGEWWDATYEDAIAIGNLMGLEVGQEKRGHRTDLWFSGFSSQGDGACWGGSIDWRQFEGAIAKVTGYAPQDERLAKLAADCESVYKEIVNEIKSLANPGEEENALQYLVDSWGDASVKSNDRYNQSKVEVDAFDCDDEDIFQDGAIFHDENYRDAFQELADDFANWICRQLEAEYDYLTSEEQLIDLSEANEYTFDEYGNREG